MHSRNPFIFINQLNLDGLAWIRQLKEVITGIREELMVTAKEDERFHLLPVLVA